VVASYLADCEIDGKIKPMELSVTWRRRASSKLGADPGGITWKCTGEGKSGALDLNIRQSIYQTGTSKAPNKDSLSVSGDF